MISAQIGDYGYNDVRIDKIWPEGDSRSLRRDILFRRREACAPLGSPSQVDRGSLVVYTVRDV
jgi:hypothetical protein